MAVLIVCVVSAVALLCSSIVRWPGYWREPLLANVLVDVGTDRIPGTVNGSAHNPHIYDVPPPTLRNRITRGDLRHTAICDDAAVTAAIGNWIAAG